MWHIFSGKRLKWYFFLKMSFHLIFQVFLAKIRKKFKVGNVRNYDEEAEYSEKKKRFHPPKRHLQQCWRAQNIPEVAECLVQL